MGETTANETRNTNNVKEIVNKVTSQENRLYDLENESGSSKSSITKINDHMESISKTIQVFEGRHVETIEKVKEVSVLASNIEVNVKAQEQKMEQQKANDFNQFSNQLEQLKKQQENSNKKVSDIDADNHTLMEKTIGLERNFENRLKSLDEIDNDIRSRLGTFQVESTQKIKSVEDESKYNRERLILLEEAHQQQLQKAVYVENLGARVNQLDEMRQQSEAKAKDEVDATISQSNRLINTLQTEFEEKVIRLEKFVKSEQDIFVNKSQEINQEIMTIKGQTDVVNKKIAEISHENQTFVSTKIGAFVNEIDQKLTGIDQTISSKLSKYESENRVNLEIMQIKSDFEEKLVTVNQNVSQERDIHKSEKDILVGQINNLSMTIESLNQQNQTLFAENKRIESSMTANLNYSEEKFNQQEELLQNSIVNYQELLEEKLRELGEETKLNSKSLVEIEPLAKSIDTRLVLLQNSNAEKLEVIKEQILVENTHHIESFRSEVSTSLVSVTEKNESVEKHVQVFKDTSDKIKSDIQAIISKEQEIQQSKLSDIIKESELVTNDFRLKMDQQLSTISDNFIGQQEKFETIQSSMSSLVKKVHTIESSDTRQNDLLSKLEDKGDNLGSKLSSLESADIFLQEAHRMHTEKALDIEKECKRMEQTFVQFYKDQRQEIDSRVKVDISNLQLEKKNSKEIMENILKRVTSTESRLMEIEQYTQNSNETIVLNMQENLNKLEKSSNDRATDLENTVIKYYEQIGVNKDNIKQINQLTTELGNNLHSLNDNLEESINAQKLFETHQNEFNKASDMQMKAELERFDRVESDMNNSIQNLTKQYTEVDNKIVTILNDKFTNLQTIIESYESKNKDTIHNMHDLTDRTSSIEKILESKFSLIDEKYNEHSNRINSLQESNMLQNQKVGNVKGSVTKSIILKTT